MTMENSLALDQLRTVLNRLPAAAYNNVDHTEWNNVISLLAKHKEDRAALLWYLLLTTDHDHQDELQLDSNVGFLMTNTTNLIKMNYFVSLFFPIYHNEFCDMIRYGTLKITQDLIDTIMCTVDETILQTCFQLQEVVLFKSYFLEESNALKCMRYNMNDFMSKPLKNVQDEANRVYYFLKSLENSLENNSKNSLENNSTECKSLFYKLDIEYPNENSTFDAISKVFIPNAENVLKTISIETWISFAECKLEGGTESAQLDIGHLIYKVGQLLEEKEIKISSEMSSCINQLKIKPPSQQEIFAKFTWQDLVDKIEETEDGIPYTELSTREEAWIHPRGKICLISKIHLGINEFLIEKCLQIIINEIEEMENYANLFLASLKKLDLPTLTKYSPFLVGQLPSDYSSNDDLTLIFNKISNHEMSEAALKEVVIQALVNIEEVMRELFEFAETSTENHVFALEIYGSIKYLFNENGSYSVLSSMLQERLYFERSDKQWDNLIQFIRFLAEDSMEFSIILEVVLEETEKAIENNNLEHCQHMIEILNALCSIKADYIDTHLPPLLVFFAAIMGNTAWDVHTFDPAKATIRRQCTDVIKRLGLVMSSGNADWVKDALKSIFEPVRAVFSFLWTDLTLYPDINQLYVQLLVRPPEPPISAYDSTSLACALLKIISVVDSGEWPALFSYCKVIISSQKNFPPEENISCDSKVFKQFSDIMTFFACSADPTMYPTFEYCFSNLTQIFNTILIGNGNLAGLFSDLVRPLNEVKNDVRDRCYVLVLPSLLKCLKMEVENGGDVNVLIDLVHESARQKLFSIISKWELT